MSLSERIRDKRTELKLSQAALAKKAGTSQQSIDRLERGDTQHSRSMDGIAEALGVTRQWLLFGTPSVAPETALFQPASRPGGSEETGRHLPYPHRPNDMITVSPTRIRLIFDREMSPATAMKILAMIEEDQA